MSQPSDRFLAEHAELSRRYFLRMGGATLAAAAALPALGADAPSAPRDGRLPNPRDPKLQAVIDKLEPFLTKPSSFQDVSRGSPVPHKLDDEKKKAVGLTRETWKLEVISDPDHPAKLSKPMTKADGTALDFAGLMKLGETHAVKFAKVMTCLNIGCPLGAGIWEGVPLRVVLWMTKPTENLRRVFYYGYHNDDPKQMFRSSLPVGRVLEDPFDLPPVILCYKLNGEFLDSERGGPVRIVVPESYGFKNVKWLSHVVLTNYAHSNDTYAEKNNDVDSPLKSFAATLSSPSRVKSGEPIPITGYAQVGISGLSKVQVWIEKNDAEGAADDPYFLKAPWQDAEILAPPKVWGGDLPEGKMLAGVQGFDAEGQPKTWPMRLLKAHWAALWPGLPAGNYTLRSRTVDEKGQPQPMPRPFRKSGHAAIQEVGIVVEG